MSVPERTMGTRCGHMVERGHVAYPCTLPQGHEDNWGEPHYAVEVDASVRAWRRWSQEDFEDIHREEEVVELPATEPDSAIMPERVIAEETDVFVGTAMDDAVDDRFVGWPISHDNLTSREKRWAEVLGFHHLDTDTIVGSHQRDQLDAALALADSEFEHLTQEIVLLHQILKEVRAGKSRWDSRQGGL